MKEANNNEMDTLLRSYARGVRGAGGKHDGWRADGERPVAGHMDADELNAFTEGAVPERARARFVEHLADCGNCRSIVVSLTQAKGVQVASPLVDKQSAPAFWDRLSAFLSPAVLRYAVPAMALAAVMVVSFIALRKQANTDFVAQHQPASAPLKEDQSSNATASPESRTQNAQDQRQNPVQLSAPRVNDVPQDTKTLQDKASVTTGTTEDSRQDARVAAAVEPKPTFAPEAPAPPPPAATQVNRTENFMISKEEAEREANQQQRAQPQTANDNYSSRVDMAKNSPSNMRRVEGLMAERRSQGARQKRGESDEAETRTVSGREFRREGSGWVDTGYSSSMSTISVARGSEHYRALVADEPGLGNIASQFSGDVLIVWKGKAYRIY